MAWDDFLKPTNPATGQPYPNNSDGEFHLFGNPNARTLANEPTTEENWLAKLTDMADQGNTAAMEKLVDYYATRESEKTARDWTAQREDTAYQRLMADFQKAGISPYVLSGASPMASASAGKSYSGSQMVSQRSQQKTKESNDLKAILSIIGVVIGAMAMAA